MAGGFGVESSGVAKDYPGEVTVYVLITCITAAMGGLIFGYDIGISGNAMLLSYHHFLSSVIRAETSDLIATEILSRNLFA